MCRKVELRRDRSPKPVPGTSVVSDSEGQLSESDTIALSSTASDCRAYALWTDEYIAVGDSDGGLSGSKLQVDALVKSLVGESVSVSDILW